MRVAVTAEGEATTRAAQSLATHPDVEVVLLGPADSSQFEVVRDLAGCEAAFGAERAAEAANEAGIPAVVTGDLATGPGITWASPYGLALALAESLGEESVVAVAEPGEATGSEEIVFPSPIDGRTTERIPVRDRTVLVGRGDGPLCATLALGSGRHRVIVDDHKFLSGVALAAAVGVLQAGAKSEPTPVWQQADTYLAAAASMGLVMGERAA